MVSELAHDELIQFGVLWREYLFNQVDQGSPIRPSQKTQRFYLDLARAYTAKQLPGVALWVPERACLLWGAVAINSPIDTDDDPIAQGWGTYVRPQHRGEGLSKMLRESAKQKLREMGFRTVLGSVLMANDLGESSGVSAGFEITQKSGILRLCEE